MVRSDAVTRLALLALPVLLVLAGACRESPIEPPLLAEVSGPAPVGLVALSTSTGQLDIVGATRRYSVTVYDRTGSEIDPTGVQVTSSHPGVAIVEDVDVYSYHECDTSVGVCERRWGAGALIREVGAGTASISASFRGVAASPLDLNVRPVPTAAADLVIDSFTVVEYRPSCSWDCPYHAHVPLLRLREPEGTSGEVLRAISFTIPPLSTGLCQSDGPTLAPGESRQVNASFDPYLWSNDFFLVNLKGPLPDGQATVRVIVEGPGGELRMVEATAPIVRNGTPPLGDPSMGCGY
jgi:hypothetical protein